MSTTIPELDPVAIREALIIHRDEGHQFEEAWLDVVGFERDYPDERAIIRFMKANFRAAYYDDDSARGRCLVPERDVSMALVMAARSNPSPDHERCQSGDGCDRLAVGGRFGVTFCTYHGEELERIAVKFTRERHEADPRAGGNHSIFGSRGKKAA